MLVQKQTPERLKKILLYGGIPIVLLGGFILYNNMSSDSSTDGNTTGVQVKTAPKDFGQALFRDARFYALSPKVGTQLITQSTAVIPATTIPAPEVTAFDVRTGGTILFTWKMPAGADATAIRINRINGELTENLATLPAKTTSFLFSGATDRQAATYTLAYIKQTGLTLSAQVPAKTGSVNGNLTVAAADNAGVRLTWNIPAGATDREVEIYRSEAVGTLGKRIGTLGAGSTSFDDQGGRADLHFYTVAWVTETKVGAQWSGQMMSTDATPPEAPDYVTATYDATNAVVRISWAPSTSLDVRRYEVYRSDKSLSLGRFIGDKQVADVATLEQVSAGTDCSKELCLEDRTPPSGTTLYYAVIAFDATGNRSSTQELGVSGRANPFVSL